MVTSYIRESSFNPYDISRIDYRIRSEKDRRKIRDLAKIVKEISQYPMMQDRTKQWKAHNSLKSRQPLVLVFPEGSWRELLPASNLTCEADNARCIEWELRKRIYKYENIYDDTVFEDKWIVTKSIADTGWGLAPKRIVLDENEKPGRMQTAYRYEPLIHVPADLKKLKYPEVVYDEKDSIQRYEAAQELFGDILNVEVRGTGQLSFCYTPLYSKLRGLSQVMLDMFEEPNMLHDAMAFMEQGYEKLIEQYVQMNLLSLNNDSTYHSSGGIGFTDELPKDGFDPENVRPQDIWASAQSQEMSGVSPEMHYEFIMKHEIKSLRHFGLNGYGCCENLTQKMKYVFEIPTIRRISISPWADVEECADNLKDKYIYSWKPNPAYLAGNDFDEVFIRNYIQHTLEATKDCVLEIILKDTHTCRNEPERITKWTQIVRDAIEKS